LDGPHYDKRNPDFVKAIDENKNVFKNKMVFLHTYMMLQLDLEKQKFLKLDIIY
jgi:hypothetical protein